MTLNPKGRDWGNLVNWDSLGQAYTAFIIIWTVILYAGVFWMIANRRLPSIKIRNVPIAVTSVSFLHIYLLKIVMAYTTNGHFPCSAEFWIMSIYLPFGIALFQANLVQLHSISDQQKKLLSSAASSTVSMRRSSGLLGHWKNLPQLKKAYVYIGIGMAVQLIITAVLYATSPTLQGDWSSYGNVTHAKGQALCRKSLEWVPSAFWQLLWSWVFGLYTLWKIRNIRDVHYWRLGTWLSIISGLPGTPLWIAAVFCQKFKPVNIRWVPPMWLAPGILVMQVVTIFFPIYEAFESRKHMRTTLSLIKDWEEKGTNKTAGSSIISDQGTASYSISTRSKEIFSMASLEKALAINPLPLLHFAASKDFTAENIIFLMRVREWRQAWATAPRDPVDGELTENARNTLFRLAVEIYMVCVLDTISDFPININASIRTKLDQIFEHAVPEGKKRISSDSGSSMFDGNTNSYLSQLDSEVKRVTLVREKSDNSGTTIWSTKPRSPNDSSWSEKSPTFTAASANTSDVDMPIFQPHPAISPLGSARAKIRDGFDQSVFDAAEASVKYLVLTNTWRKFAAASQIGPQLDAV